jgi:phosphatidylinositol phospholipase C, delta
MLPPARCVEIDAWYTSSGPIVTHGHTFTQSIPFQAVCVAIGETVKPDSLPITVSLECHVEVDKQVELVEIMKTTWGDKLIAGPVHKSLGDKIHGLLDHRKASGRCTSNLSILICPFQAKVSPDDLRGKIFMMIEYHLDNPAPVAKKEDEPDSSSSLDSDFSDSEQARDMKAFHEAHKAEYKKVHPQLAALGVYAQSIEPKGNWLVQELLDPLHALINISESGLRKLLPHSLDGLVSHASKYMRRCYPRGTRVRSSNMDPLPVWRAGTQVAALNMQAWDLGTQLNAALFEGSQGWVLKPESLRGGQRRSGEVTFKVEVIGADDGQYLWKFAGVHFAYERNDGQFQTLQIRRTQRRILLQSYSHPQGKIHTTPRQSKITVVTPCGMRQSSGSTRILISCSSSVSFLFSQLRGGLMWLRRLRIYEDQWGKDALVAVFTAHVDRLEKGLRFWPLIGGDGNTTPGKVMVRVH